MSKNCFVSWSGGKDSCLALYMARERGFVLKKLLTMFSVENQISTAHRLSEDVIRAQADAIGVDCSIGRTPFHDYEEVFASIVKEFKGLGIDYGIFGDIDLEEHRKWEENVCSSASVTAILPLWQRNRRELVEEFLRLGFKAKIVVVNTSMLHENFLGRDLSCSLLNEIEDFGADACGEYGEYHTVVYDGPIFKSPVDLTFGVEKIPVGDRYAQILVKA